jgi:hypothetical protein
VAGWNVTEIGTTGTFANAGAGEDYFKGVIFNNNLVFWRVINSTNFAITALSLSNYTFKDVFNFTSPVGAVLSQCAPTDMNNTQDPGSSMVLLNTEAIVQMEEEPTQ